MAATQLLFRIIPIAVLFFSLNILAIQLSQASNIYCLEATQLGTPDTVKFNGHLTILPHEPSAFIQNADTSEYVLIYPNPASAYIYVECNFFKARDIFITFYDQSGIKVAEYFKPATSANKYKLNLGHLSQGKYYVRINSDTEFVLLQITLVGHKYKEKRLLKDCF